MKLPLGRGTLLESVALARAGLLSGTRPGGNEKVERLAVASGRTGHPHHMDNFLDCGGSLTRPVANTE